MKKPRFERGFLLPGAGCGKAVSSCAGANGYDVKTMEQVRPIRSVGHAPPLVRFVCPTGFRHSLVSGLYGWAIVHCAEAWHDV
ncbi:hypothetical protein D9M72_558700 [compost metagenome]